MVFFRYVKSPGLEPRCKEDTEKRRICSELILYFSFSDMSSQEINRYCKVIIFVYFIC